MEISSDVKKGTGLTVGAISLALLGSWGIPAVSGTVNGVLSVRDDHIALTQMIKDKGEDKTKITSLETEVKIVRQENADLKNARAIQDSVISGMKNDVSEVRGNVKAILTLFEQRLNRR